MPTITGSNRGNSANVATLRIRGVPDKYNYRTLTILGPPTEAGLVNLTVPTSPVADVPLSFVANPVASGFFDTIINGGFGSGDPGAADMQNVANLSVSAMSESGFPVSPPTTDDISQNGVVGLTVFSTGVGLQNNDFSLTLNSTVGYISGFLPSLTVVAGTGGSTKGFLPININAGIINPAEILPQDTVGSGNFNLNIKTDFNISSNATLHINSKLSKGFMAISTEGLVSASGDATLFIDNKATNNNINIFTRGYLE